MINNKKSSKEILDEMILTWVKIFGQLSYCGKKKFDIYKEFDAQFGEENWIPAHFFDGTIISRHQAYQVYEDGYYYFLKNNPAIRERLVKTASEVYDITPSNVNSKMDYEIQECSATHLQDISIRRSLTKLRLEELGLIPDLNNLPEIKIFHGNHLVQIRDHTTEGYYLNPGKVPFHRPELILQTQQTGWWEPGSVEDFYQKNKVLLVNPNNLLVQLAMADQNQYYFKSGTDNYYQVTRESELPLEINWMKGKHVRKFYSEDKNCIEVSGSPIKPYSFWRNNNPSIPAGNRRFVFKEAL